MLLGIRCIGFGNRAYVALTMTNALTGAEVSSPAPLRPQLLLCREPPPAISSRSSRWPAALPHREPSAMALPFVSPRTCITTKAFGLRRPRTSS